MISFLRDRYGSSETAEAEISLEDGLEVLANSRRRYVIGRLAAIDQTTNIDDLSRQIAAIENDVALDDVDADERKRVYIGLYQVHLKKLDEEGVIEWDQRSGDVEATPTTSTLADVLEHASDHLGGGFA